MTCDVSSLRYVYAQFCVSNTLKYYCRLVEFLGHPSSSDEIIRSRASESQTSSSSCCELSLP